MKWKPDCNKQKFPHHVCLRYSVENMVAFWVSNGKLIKIIDGNTFFKKFKNIFAKAIIFYEIDFNKTYIFMF